MFILYLNPMPDRTEACRPVARAETKEALFDFVRKEMVEPYKDGQWHKVFRQGGPLEWFNPPDTLTNPEYQNPWYREIVDAGSLEDWKRRAEEEWYQMCASLPLV